MSAIANGHTSRTNGFIAAGILISEGKAATGQAVSGHDSAIRDDCCAERTQIAVISLGDGIAAEGEGCSVDGAGGVIGIADSVVTVVSAIADSHTSCADRLITAGIFIGESEATTRETVSGHDSAVRDDCCTECAQIAIIGFSNSIRAESNRSLRHVSALGSS